MNSDCSIAHCKPYSHGGDKEGLCGSLHSAIECCPEMEVHFRAHFENGGGSVRCEELRATGTWSCRDCVREGTTLVAMHLRGEL
ncbi:hypothetical protein KIPB_015941 [Kipferlia bialata]|uniref:Uncharacterized protein n=1 Tax=Kipferlia bialata TaxID=797122 RepID=A0A391P4U3_9EUKA|nr:hypothetical protein KIPB_015941 [Kipferlia bialata]|eukprot:g15941.t1